MFYKYFKIRNKEQIKISVIRNIMVLMIATFIIQVVNAQQVEVQGELKVTQMTANDTEENLVTRKTDGTLGTRSVASLPPPPPPIDTTRNLASDFELAKLLCQCQSLPPFLIKALLDQGYTENDLLLAGITLPAIQGSQAILDGDGNEYTSITIGNQTWLRENLKTTSHIDGVPIVHSTSYPIWIGANSSGTPSYSYVNNSNSYTDQFGLLYNWYTVENNDVCPLGFRVPEIADWVTLDNYFGSSDDVYLKEMGFDYWVQPNQFSTNSSGFSARGPGHRDDLWNYYQFKARQSWWSTTESSGDTTKARFAQIWPGGGDLNTSSFGNLKAFGYSIRCIKN